MRVRRPRKKGDDYALMPGLPHRGVYRMFSVDPPWEHDNYGQAKHGASKAKYNEMTLDELCEMPVGELAHADGAVMFLWCTGCQEADGAHRALAEAWGFRVVTRAFTWCKVVKECQRCGHDYFEHAEPGVVEDLPGRCSHVMRSNADDLRCKCTEFVPKAVRGPGSYTMQGVETVWLCTRGDGWSIARAARDVPEIVFAPRLGHSKKPDVFQARMERLWPLAEPRLEIFARRRLDGWAAWGKQAPKCDFVFGAAIGSRWPVVRTCGAAGHTEPGQCDGCGEHACRIVGGKPLVLTCETCKAACPCECGMVLCEEPASSAPRGDAKGGARG